MKTVGRSFTALLAGAIVTTGIGAALAATTRQAREHLAGARPTVTAPSAAASAATNLPTDPFTIDLPSGWVGGEQAAGHLYDAGRSWRWANAEGNFFVVNIDPDGSDFEGDAVWRVAATDARGVTIAERGGRCGREEGLCSALDGRLDLWALWSEGGSVPLGEHVYYFHFGNVRDEQADEAVFAQILLSLRSR